MKTPLQIAEQYLAIWNETNESRRRALIEAAFISDATYQDPLMKGGGHDGLDAMIAAAQLQFAGLRFALSGTPDGHNDVVRFSWSAGLPDDVPAAHGTDVAIVADGRIRSVIGFLDTVQP